MPCPPGFEPSTRRLSAASEPRALQDVLEDTPRYGVDQHPAGSRSASAVANRRLVRVGLLARVLDFVRCRREDIVGEVDLTRMDGPLPDRAERRGPSGLAPIAIRVSEIAERPIDGVDTIGAARRDHTASRVVPEIAGVAVRGIGGDAEAHALACRQVAKSENERLEPRRAGRKYLDPCECGALFDQRFEPNLVLDSLPGLDLCEQGVEKPDVTGRARLGYDDDVQKFTRALYYFDYIVVSPVRISAVDAYRAHLLAPLEFAQRRDCVLTRGFLLRGSDSVFEIEEYQISSGAHRLLHHLRVRSGH